MTDLTIHTKQLQQALAAVSLVLPRNSPNEEWNHVAIRAKVPDPSWIHATSGKMTAVAPISTLDTSLHGAHSGNFLLNEACRKAIDLATADVVMIAHRSTTRKAQREVEGRIVEDVFDSVLIGTGSGNYNLDVQNLPVFVPKDIDFSDCLEFHPDHFVDLVSLLSPITDEITTRMNLSGVHVSVVSPVVAKAIATDGRRIGIGEFPCCVQGTLNQAARAPVMPKSLLQVVKQSIALDAKAVRVAFTDSHCGIAVGDTVYSSPLAEARFPSVVSAVLMLQKEGTKVGAVSRKTLIYGLDLAKICLDRSRDYVGVTVSGNKGTLSFSAHAPDSGKCHVLLDNGVMQPFEITLDPKYLLPILKNLKDDLVALTVIDNQHMMVDVPYFRYLLAGVEAK